jgi:hypothetical protein
MQPRLIQSNGMAALAEPCTDFPALTRFSNATNVLGASQSLITPTDELSWFGGATAVGVPPLNRSFALVTAAEEAEILTHPDIAAAVDATLPQLEAWERTL